MNEQIIKLLLLLHLGIIILLLSATPIFRGNKEQRNYQKNGMRILSVPRSRVLLLPSLGIFLMLFLSTFAYLAIMDGAWDEAGSMILLCLGIGLFTLIAGFFCGYLLQKRHILYDDEKLLIGRAFHPYQRVEWYEISRMDIKNQDAFSLYDREGIKRVSATSDLNGYHDLYEMSVRHCKPEYRAAAEYESAYQKQYNMITGQGMLRYRTGEYSALFIISLLLVIMTFAMGLVSGNSIEDMGTWLFSREGLETKLIIFALMIISIVMLIYTNLQKITYDPIQITFDCFPKRKKIVNWNEIEKIDYCAQQNNRRVTLYTQNKKYVIKEKQFRNGFSEFVLELQKRH